MPQTPFSIECRAVDFEKSVSCKDMVPAHPEIFSESIRDIIKSCEGLQFTATIKSPANSYQIDLDFDFAYFNSLRTTGKWKDIPFDAKTLNDIPNIKPDFLLSNNQVILCTEIEKSNEKTIWFDLIKLMMLMNRGVAQFGLIVAPRNYAHKTGVWPLFERAQFYHYCLYKYAEVDLTLIERIAIVGYTQEAMVLGDWKRLSKDVITLIKKQANQHFLTQ